MSKYAALRDHLMNLKANQWNSNFYEIEDILGFTLPNSARNYPAWWANQKTKGHTQCSGWLDAGWKTSQLNLTGERITFLKTGQKPGDDTEYKPTKSELNWSDVVMDDEAVDKTSFEVSFSWRRLGDVFIDQKDRLAFPQTPIGPAVYRLVLKRGKKTDVYIGEAEEVSRRMQHYRTPGVTQQTNKRMNATIKECLTDDGKVSLFVAQVDDIDSSRGKINFDFTNKYHRRLIEQVALVDAEKSKANILNR